jgi:hypothetical protein
MPRPDLALVRLARNWIERLYPIGKFIRGISGLEDWRTEYIFYQSLLGFGCKVVGRDASIVFMRCDNKTVRLFLGSLFFVRRDLRSQIRELEYDELVKLTGGAPYVELMFPIGVYGTEPIEVMRLVQGSIFVKPFSKGIRRSIPLEGPVDLYLNRVELRIGRLEISFYIWLEPRGVTESPIYFIDIYYDFKESARPRPHIVVSTYDKDYNLADKEVEGSILEALNEKSSVIDELISQAVPVLRELLKWLVIYALY